MTFIPSAQIMELYDRTDMERPNPTHELDGAQRSMVAVAHCANGSGNSRTLLADRSRVPQPQSSELDNASTRDLT